MYYVGKLLAVVGLNGVVLWGLGLDGWSGPTALAIYWLENLISSLLIGLRIAVHRRLTRKRGHFRAQLGVELNGQKIHSFLTEFLTAGIAFTVAHGLFLAVLLGLLFKSLPDVQSFRQGAVAVAAFQLLAFCCDVSGIGHRSFAWMKRLAQAGLARIVLVHLVIVGGMAAVALTNSDRAFFLVFAGLKLLVEFGSVFSGQQTNPRAPGWLLRLMKRWKPETDFAAYLAEEHAKELAREVEDEEIAEEHMTAAPLSNDVHSS